jgi:hypothetical protein
MLQRPTPANAITHTGSGDGDFIYIPDCSDSQYYKDHHLLIQAGDGSWTVSIWNNDHQSHRLYWNTADAYAENNPVAGTDGDGECSFLIRVENGRPVVTAAPWS